MVTETLLVVFLGKVYIIDLTLFQLREAFKLIKDSLGCQ